MAGDFNVNLDSSDAVASRLLRFIMDCSLVRCDDIFPLQKTVTYVNLALSHQSFIDYILTSEVLEVFEVLDVDINFSDHLLLAIISCIHRIVSFTAI